MSKRFINPLFIDIETVSCAENYQALNDQLKPLWEKKATYLGATTQGEKEKLFFDKAGIYAEFGKIIVIAIGYLTTNSQGVPSLHVKGLSNHDEKQLLQDFKKILEEFPQPGLQLCGHNSREFDFPYLCRRLILNGLSLPPSLDIAGKKPWEINHLDTMELWKFGDRKSFTSLELLALIFNIPSSKSDLCGSQVNHCYYIAKDLPKIERYCRQDVVTTAQVFRKMQLRPLVAQENINLI